MQEKVGRQGDKQFKEILSAFPSSFDLNFDILTKEKKQAEREYLLSKLEGKFTIVEQEIQLLNFVSFLSFLLGDSEKAYELNDTVLEKRNSNVTALVNRAWFNRKNGRFYQAQKGLEKLLSECEYERVG